MMRYLVAILIILLVMLQYDLWVGDGSLATVWRLKQAVEVQQTENESLQERNAALEGEVKDLKSGLDAIEERARSELGMIQQGETYIQVIEPDDGKVVGTAKE